MDKIENLKAFICVASEGSFTKAAERLELSNQLVSKYVSQLEAHLSVRLFNRTTRKVHLTEAGEQCLQHAQQVVESMNDMEGYFGNLHNTAQGQLNISAPVSFATLHLSPLLRAFKKNHEHVAINLQLNDRKIDVIEEGFDVALRIGHLKSSSMIARKIAPIKLLLCASPEYLKVHGTPQKPIDLNPKHFLRYSLMNYHELGGELMQALARKANKEEAGITSNNGEVLQEAAIAGEGYVLQPSFIVGKALKEGRLRVILPDFEPEPLGLYAVYPHRKLLATKLRVFIDFMSEYFGDSPYWDDYK